jgi:hypothetical protein
MEVAMTPEEAGQALPEMVGEEVAPQKFVFEVGHDYEIIWMIDNGTHRAPRRSRVGYIGSNRNGNRILLFDARGPNRRCDGNFGHTQAIDRRWLISVKEVPRHLGLRYVARET